MRIALATALLATLGLFTAPANTNVLPLAIDVSVGPSQSGQYELLRAPHDAQCTGYLTVRDANGRRAYANLALPVPPSGHDLARKHTQWFDVTFAVKMQDRRCETSVVIEHEGRVWYEQKNAISLTSSASPSPR
jgi:hypothetical protein